MPRRKGDLNKVTKETREFVSRTLNGEQENIQKALNQLFLTNQAAYLNVIVKLLPFVTPKATELHIHNSNEPQKEPSWFCHADESRQDKDVK